MAFIKSAFTLGLMIICLAILQFVALRYDLIGFGTLDLALAQASVFPLVVIGFWLIIKQSKLIPCSIVLTSGIAGAIALVIAYSVWSNGQTTAHIAKFSEDEFEAKSKIFREGLNSKLKKIGHQQAYRYWDEVSDLASAKKVLENEDKVSILLWGSEKGLSLNFKSVISSSFQELAIPSLSKHAELRFIWQVPRITLSYQPLDDTQSYLAYFLAGYSDYLHFLKDFSVVNPNRMEINLLKSAGWIARWRIAEPRGLAWWVVGNYYVLKAIKEPESQVGYLNCAKLAYSKAASLVFSKFNPELFSAIHNNYALVRLLQAYHQASTPHSRNKVNKPSKSSLIYAMLAKKEYGSKLKDSEVFNIATKNLRSFAKKKVGKSKKKNRKNKKNKRKKALLKLQSS